MTLSRLLIHLQLQFSQLEYYVNNGKRGWKADVGIKLKLSGVSFAFLHNKENFVGVFFKSVFEKFTLDLLLQAVDLIFRWRELKFQSLLQMYLISS